MLWTSQENILAPVPAVPRLPGIADLRSGELGHNAGRAVRGKLGGPPAPPSPGLILWVKADAQTFQDSALTTAALADGDVVGGWQDQSGNLHHLTQATAANKPILKLAQVNSKPCVRFDGVNDLLSSLFTLNPPFDCFMMVKPIAWIAEACIVDGAVGDTWAIMQHGVTPAIVTYNGGSLGGTNNGLVIGTWALLEAGGPVGGVANAYSKVNNVAAVLGGALIVADRGGLMVGGHPGPSNFANIDVAEVLLYSSILSAGDVTSVHTYFTSKYAIP